MWVVKSLKVDAAIKQLIVNNSEKALKVIEEITDTTYMDEYSER